MTDQNRLQEERDSLREVLSVTSLYFNPNTGKGFIEKEDVLEVIQKHKAKFEKPDWAIELKKDVLSCCISWENDIRDVESRTYDMLVKFRALGVFTKAMDELVRRCADTEYKTNELNQKLITVHQVQECANQIRKGLEG